MRRECGARRKFRQTRSQVTDPLAMVSDGNGRATDRPLHPSDASLGPSPAIISTVTYVRARSTRARNISSPGLPREDRYGESRGKYASFTEENYTCVNSLRDAHRARSKFCAIAAWFVCATLTEGQGEGRRFPRFLLWFWRMPVV